MTQEITLYEKTSDPMALIERLGTALAKSGFAGCDRLEQGQVIAWACVAKRIDPFEFTETYDIVDGKLRRKAMAAFAEFRKRGGKVKWVKTGDEAVQNEDEREAVGEFSWEGQVVTCRFTMADAKRAELVRPRSNWVKTPSNMLRARVASNAIGMLAPEIYAGGSDEEPQVAKVAEPLLKDVTPPTAPVATTTKTTIKITAVPPDTEQELAAVGLAPSKPVEAEIVQPAPTAAPPPPAAPPRTDIRLKLGSTNKLDAESIGLLQGVIGDANSGKAFEWLKNRGWIKDDLADLSVDRARRIMSKPSEFLKTIGATT